MIPVSLIHMNCQRIATTKLGTTQGAIISVRTVRLSGNSRFSSTAIPIPTTSVRPTVHTV